MEKEKKKVKWWQDLIVIILVPVIILCIGGIINFIYDKKNDRVEVKYDNSSKVENKIDNKLNNKKDSENESKIEKLIKQQAEYVRDLNKGTVKYDSYTTYATTDKGEKIYKINYTSSYNKEAYTVKYYQLVSLDKDLTTIEKIGSLYKSTYAYGKEVTNDNDQLEWEAHKIWGI